MKQIFISGFLFLQMIGTTAFAQTVLTYQTHGANEGDVVTLKGLDKIAPGNAGAYQVWDYSGAKLNGSHVIHYNADPSATQKSGGKAFACQQDENTTVYLNITPTQKLYYGLTTDNAKIEFEEPLKELVFPFQYQSQIGGKLKGTYTDLTSGQTEPLDGEYSIEADAWGTLILPNGVTLKNVLRVKYVKKYDQVHAGTVFHIMVNSYLFYAAESRYAVVQIKDSEVKCECGCTNKEFSAYYDDSVTPASKGINIDNNNKGAGLLAKTKAFVYTLYPNPFEKELRLEYSIAIDAAKIKVNILDLSGKKLKTLVNAKQKQGDYSVSADLGSLPDGTYVLQIQADDELHAEKIIKKSN